MAGPMMSKTEFMPRGPSFSGAGLPQVLPRFLYDEIILSGWHAVLYKKSD